MNALDATSTRPYLIRALHEWCTDNGFTPYIAVLVDETVQVPREYVKNNEIVLNIGFDATSSLKLGNEFIEFKARFAGSGREIMVPITHVIAIYARENGQGMSFPMMLPAAVSLKGVDTASATPLVSETGMTSSVNAAADAPEIKIMQLVPESAASSGEEGPDMPEPPKSPPRTRPALTRVK
ncbi:MAG: ClpXP protease specificity-enhancing factor [Polaromonas sp.]|nr:ClpXP protease specificity-enhancing factor [Polaromonas sp.]